MVRTFINVAELIKHKRLNHPKRYSQSELSRELGYKNGQFISNIERGLCSMPAKTMMQTCLLLNIQPDEFKEAVLKDYEAFLNSVIQQHETDMSMNRK